jgi:uncharacterized membrane protein YjjP (DUF1212 family)
MSTKEPDDYVEVVLLILAAFCGPLFVIVLYGGDMSELVGATSQGHVRFYIRLGSALLCGTLAHIFIRRPFRASLAAGGIYSLVQPGVSFCITGHVDPFFLIGLFVGFFIGFAVAAPLGVVFRLCRHK